MKSMGLTSRSEIIGGVLILWWWGVRFHKTYLFWIWCCYSKQSLNSCLSKNINEIIKLNVQMFIDNLSPFSLSLAEAALRSLMKRWKNVPASWGKSSPCDMPWDGILCDENGRVTSLWVQLIPPLSVSCSGSWNFFLLTLDIRNLFGMGMGGTLSDDIGSLTELTILWVPPSCILPSQRCWRCFTIYVRTLNHSLSEHFFAEICPQTEILVGHCQLPLGSCLSLNLCKLQQFLLRTEGPMLILSYTLLITIDWFCRALIGCSFSGPVPSELGNLSQLTFL